jgi:hypothetical protein
MVRGDNTLISKAELAELRRDKERLDYMQNLGGKYTGRYVLRMSDTGRSLRLHETSREDGQPSVREAIDAAMTEKAGGES